MSKRAPRTGVATPTTAGAALLRRLKQLGVDYVLANAGTDFPPLIEALALAQAAGRAGELPEALVIPHEHAAMSMAHGYYLATGRPLAVIAHTNVGLANCAIGAINAAVERVPVLLFSGRTPVTEHGRLGARTIPIGWGQEMRDQAALVRESVKWEYELRFPEQAAELADRMHAIALSTPPGPVYMSLPREVLSQLLPPGAETGRVALKPVRCGPDASALAEAAALIAAAEAPVIFAQHGPRTPAGFAALQRICESFAVPVVQYWANQLALASTHPMWAGIDAEPWIGEADVIVVLDSLAPWMPERHRPREGCRVIQAGPDPLMARMPVRGFPADVALAGDLDDVVGALADALAGLKAKGAGRRRRSIEERNAAMRARIRACAAAGNRAPMSKEWVAHCVSEAVQGRRDVTVLSELGAPLQPMALAQPGAFYQEPHAGGLGWAFGCGLGMQLADRNRLVVATMGDGSYMFANPTACHLVAEAHGLPLLVLVLNNAEWGAVRNAVSAMYPDGAAVRSNRMPLTSLAPSPDFVKVAQASRAHAERVESGAELPAALARALDHIRTTRTQALIDIAIGA
jgi:acetolactate synthase-1/2/3 large subunit